ncbi:hypothetical protein LKX83_31320 [Cohnella sp. REN36]|nr:hypothetical protein [Cohnella sp. REN36]MCC3377570.1 hypothetical protein [Cohnella sp. REN36]
MQVTGDGTQLKFKTEGESVEIFREGQWQPLFVQGVNLGATLPGHFPGELPLTRKDYLRWFGEIKEMGANVIRIYTIHKPAFYDALVDFNRKHADDPLFFVQGIWSPEEQLIEKRDAYLPEIRDSFREEINRAVHAVYGDLTLPETQGAASGKYKANAGPYLLAWSIGTEWDPEMVANTNKQHRDKSAYAGAHFATTAKATPFEAWLAEMIDHAAETERPYGWEHPMSFTNWVTTDVLDHPSEPLFTEDMVSVDATHVKPIDWQAGYLVTYHVYPYYPDFFRYEDASAAAKTAGADASGNAKGKDAGTAKTSETGTDTKSKTAGSTVKDAASAASASPKKTDQDTYEIYLKRLKAYHKGMPIMITEYGVPSSAGISHQAPLGRSQGGHNEQAQGEIDADLTRIIHEEGYAGAILFMWQDEWFKKTWNTVPMELPEDRRAYWLNVLTNEKQFGVLGMYSGLEDRLRIDGDPKDWSKLKKSEKTKLAVDVPGIREMWAAHDEAYVYLSIKLDHDFDPAEEQLYIGTDSLPGGNKHGAELGDRTLDEGLETVIAIGEDDASEVKIAANYDLLKRLYGYVYGMIVMSEKEIKDDSGLFNPWKLPVSLKMEPPDTKYAHPFEDADTGKLPRGTNDPKDPAYDSLAMWQYQGDFIEMRIPWMLLGLADPSTHQAISYEMPDKAFKLTKTEGIRFLPWFEDRETKEVKGLGASGAGPYPLSQVAPYTWADWDEVNFAERLKPSYYAMQDIYKTIGAQPKTGG